MKSLLLPSLSLFLLLPACGKSGGPTGTWTLDTQAMKKQVEESMARAQEKNPKMKAMKDAFMKQILAGLDKLSAELVLKGDGTFTFTGMQAGKEGKEKGEGTWKQEKDIIVLTPTSGKAFNLKSGQPLKFKLSGGTLTMLAGNKGSSGAGGLVFRKN